MFYKLLTFSKKEDFEAAATALMNHGYEPVDQVAINMVVARQNPVTGQHEMAHVFTQGFVGETPLDDAPPKRETSPLIIT